MGRKKYRQARHDVQTGKGYGGSRVIAGSFRGRTPRIPPRTVRKFSTSPGS